MDLESALAGMKDAGCTEEEIRKARRLPAESGLPGLSDPADGKSENSALSRKKEIKDDQKRRT